MQEDVNKRFFQSIQLPILFVAFIWIIHLFQVATNIDLGFLGVRPQSIEGLKGILFAPLIHADFQHLLSNSIPLLMLGIMIMYFYPTIGVKNFIIIYFLQGIAVWLMARGNRFHIGASGVVYGLVAFVFWTGIFRRSLQSIVLALVVTVLYSGYFAGVLPNQEGISWESHLFGAIIGIFTSLYFKEDLELGEELEKNYKPFAEEENNSDRPYFLPRDTFEKTKQERAQENNNPPSDWTSTST